VSDLWVFEIGLFVDRHFDLNIWLFLQKLSKSAEAVYSYEQAELVSLSYFGPLCMEVVFYMIIIITYNN